MIKKLARLLFVLALAFALPVQGVAAMSAGLCMELGHHDGGATSSHAHDDDGGADSTADAHCGPCVACCAAASISGGTTMFLGVPAAVTVEASSLSSPPDFLPDRLSRPPLAL